MDRATQMHPECIRPQGCCTLYPVVPNRATRRRNQRRRPRQSAATPISARPETPPVEQAAVVRRLTYTRRQAAEALGVSIATLDRRVLPVIETVRMPWGARLVPVDELERFVAEHTEKARRSAQPPRRPGRPAAISNDVIARIRAERAAGHSYGAIARGLDADGVEPAQGGIRWWPSTIRHALHHQRARRDVQ
jgi:hypothetical protein